MATSQENTKDVMSSPIISHDAQGETHVNLFANPPNSPNSEHMPMIGDEFVGFESDLPETPEDLAWIPQGSIAHGSQGLYILMGVIRDVSQPSTSHQKPFTALDLPVMSHCLPLRISSPPQCAPDGTDDSQWVADGTERRPEQCNAIATEVPFRSSAKHPGRCAEGKETAWAVTTLWRLMLSKVFCSTVDQYLIGRCQCVARATCPPTFGC
jgi:hypothetical protein